MIGLMTGLNGLLPPLLLAFKEIFGAVLIGLAVGLPAAYLTGRIEEGQPMLFEALGIVFLCGGLGNLVRSVILDCCYCYGNDNC